MRIAIINREAEIILTCTKKYGWDQHDIDQAMRNVAPMDTEERAAFCQAVRTGQLLEVLEAPAEAARVQTPAPQQTARNHAVRTALVAELIADITTFDAPAVRSAIRTHALCDAEVEILCDGLTEKNRGMQAAARQES